MKYKINVGITGVPKTVPWVMYECGCCEGIHIPLDRICRAHKAKIVSTSHTVSLAPPADLKALKH